MKLYSTPLHFDRDKLDCIYMPASLCACLSVYGRVYVSGWVSGSEDCMGCGVQTTSTEAI